ncbi:Wzz/FepE/Etk N-terminal domain-containing protein [Hufsiella ginkgonis]|uniref:Exopolysaccharide biosynthesis protein n=1 Tax=Hufsiella ginkgonis TaxID=2695274 RepID=A0A7K1Y282_9SPHI|nr:Wzz/FepE/Etk N-terminal domain-containing protein [Hufsiella ginkgonis]MXV17384.1 exopolysaccharide biosynthesis protein [Hufsiella ginkgonis]
MNNITPPRERIISRRRSYRQEEEEAIMLKNGLKSVKNGYRYLRAKNKIIIISAFIGALLGLAIAFLVKPKYIAECTFVLEEDSGGGLNQYKGIAAMVGLDLSGMGSSSGLFKDDNIIDLYKSRNMLEKTLLSKAAFGTRQQLLISRFIDQNKLKDKWKSAKPEDFDFSRQPFTVGQDSVIREVVKLIREEYLEVGRYNKKSSIIAVQYTGRDQLYSRAFTMALVENVNEFYIKTKTKKSAKNVRLLEHKADSVKRLLNASIGSVAAAVGQNPNPNIAIQRLKVPSQQRQVDVQANGALYSEIVKNLELARMSQDRETPLIQVIDYPKLPLEIKKISKALGLVAGGLIAGLLSVILLLLAEVFRSVD